MQLQVFSEIGPLKHVLIHKPGREVDEMSPTMLGDLLFDDILFGPKARKEHTQFCEILEACGVKTWDFQDLLETSLETTEVSRTGLVKLVALHGRLPTGLENRLQEMPAKELSQCLIAGVLTEPSKMSSDHIYELDPLPNMFFSRDAQTIIGNGVVVAAMKHNARKRESLLSHYVFSHHPEFEDNQIICDLSISSLLRSGKTFGSVSLEGGDVIVLNEGVVMVGVSERTTEQGVDILVETLRELKTFRYLIMVPMPRSRSVMHLDTIFTRASEDECLVYGPMIAKGSSESLSAITIDLTTKKKDFGSRHASVLDALKTLKIDLKPIFCGGQTSYIKQVREQWTDGANSFAIRPGMIFIYARNEATIEELSQNGYEIVSYKDFSKAPSGELKYNFKSDKKYALRLVSTELSRARGGPRCMTMPLVREPLK